MRVSLPLLGVIATVIVAHSACEGAPHLGMKLACKRYGEAWQSNSQEQVAAACATELARQIRRMKPEEFAMLQREMANQTPEVVQSGKGYGAGIVSVQTRSGLVHLHVSGSGFNWTVTDVISPDHAGVYASLKDNLDVACTAREFFENVADTSQPLVPDRMSAGLWRSFTLVSGEELARGRSILGTPIDKEGADSFVRGNRAEVVVRQSGSHSVRFKLARAGGRWIVDDVAFDTEQLSLTSLQKSFDSFCAVISLGNHVRQPLHHADLNFVVNAELRSELAQLTESPELGRESSDPQVGHILRISDDGLKAQCIEPKRQSEITLVAVGEKNRHLISEVIVNDDRGSQPLAKLLATRRQWVTVTDVGKEILSPRVFPFVLLLDTDRR
ncbi:hypothetical protein K2Y11_07995 [bacterium]|nr:hypothetical protein [bacterium]